MLMEYVAFLCVRFNCILYMNYTVSYSITLKAQSGVVSAVFLVIFPPYFMNECTIEKAILFA